MKQNFTSSSSPGCSSCGDESSVISPSHATSMLTSLNDLRSRDLLMDVTLTTCDGMSFHAHRVVLASCSEYFRAMFTRHRMKESSEKEIKLNGVSGDGVGPLIDYAYTSRISINETNCQSILSSASHLQFLDVVDSCSLFLQSRIDIENVLDILTLAETYSLSALQKKVYCFICANLLHFSQRPEFNLLTGRQLESCLRLNFPVDCPEAQVLLLVIQWIKHDYWNRISCTPFLLRLIDFREISHSAIDQTFAPILKGMITDSQSVSQGRDCERRHCVNIISVNNSIRINNCFSTHDSPSGQSGVWEDGSSSAASQDPDIKDWADDSLTACQTPCLNILSRNSVTGNGQSLVNKRGMELAILKIGGFTGATGITNEITYKIPNQRNSRWRYLTSVPHVDQCNFGSAVLNNQLFVVGGCFNQNDMQEHVHPFGFKYDPLSDSWTPIAAMRSERCRFQLVVSGQHLLALGGSGGESDTTSDPQSVSCCEVYDVEADEWRPMAGIPNACRSQHAACSASDSRIYVSGGLDQEEVLSSVFCYSLQEDKWQERRSLTAGRADHSMIGFKDQILVCGGWYEDEETGVRVLHSAVDVYDLRSDSWSLLTHVPTPRFHSAVTLIDSTLFVVGGFESDHSFDRASGAIECYDLDQKIWFSIDAYPQDIWEHATAILYVPTCRHEDDPEVRSDRSS